MGVTNVDAPLLCKVDLPKSDIFIAERSDTQKGDEMKMDTSKEGHPKSDTIQIDKGKGVKKVLKPSFPPKKRRDNGGEKRVRPTYSCPIPGCPSIVKDIRSHMCKVHKNLDFDTRSNYLRLVIPYRARSKVVRGVGDTLAVSKGEDASKIGNTQGKDTSLISSVDNTQGKDASLISSVVNTQDKDASILSSVVNTQGKDASLIPSVDTQRDDASLISSVDRKKEDASLLSKVDTTQRKDASFLSKVDTQSRDTPLLSKKSTKDMSKSSLQQKSKANSTEADMALKQLIKDLELSDDESMSDSQPRETEINEGVENDETHPRENMSDRDEENIGQVESGNRSGDKSGSEESGSDDSGDDSESDGSGDESGSEESDIEDNGDDSGDEQSDDGDNQVEDIEMDDAPMEDVPMHEAPMDDAKVEDVPTKEDATKDVQVYVPNQDVQIYVPTKEDATKAVQVYVQKKDAPRPKILPRKRAHSSECTKCVQPRKDLCLGLDPSQHVSSSGCDEHDGHTQDDSRPSRRGQLPYKNNSSFGPPIDCEKDQGIQSTTHQSTTHQSTTHQSSTHQEAQPTMEEIRKYVKSHGKSICRSTNLMGGVKGILGMPTIERYVFEVARKVLRKPMQKRRFRPLYYIGRQMGEAISMVLDMIPCVINKPDLYNYLVWMLMKLCLVLRKLRYTIREIALTYMQLFTEERVLPTMPSDGSNVFGVRFREHLINGRCHKVTHRLRSKEVQLVTEIARTKGCKVGATSLYPDISTVSLVWMKKAVQWVCDGIPSNSYVKAYESVQSIKVVRPSFYVQKKDNRQYLKCGLVHHNQVYQLAIHLSKCLEACDGAECVSRELNNQNLSPSFTKCKVLVACACGVLEQYSKDTIVFVCGK